MSLSSMLYFAVLLFTALLVSTDAYDQSCWNGPNSGAQANGKYFGTGTIASEWATGGYFATLQNWANFGQVTPINDMKWSSIEPGRGTFVYNNPDHVVYTALNNGQKLRCHALVWYRDLPGWLTEAAWTGADLNQILIDHIANVVSHYRGLCYAWDVVNEVFNADGTYADNVFFRALGTGYIVTAFKAAAEADPGAKLYYNDNMLDSSGALRSAAKGLVSMVRNSGGRIDGIGIQGHYQYNGCTSTNELIGVMSDFAGMDLDVAITELDISLELNNINAWSLQLQATGYANIVTACKNVPRCVGITIWDFDDQHSWLTAAQQGWGSATPWDAVLNPKSQIMNAILTAWCT